MDTEISYDRYRTFLAEKKSLFNDYNETTLCLKQNLEERNDKQLKACLENRHRIINRIDRINRSIDSETDNPENESAKFSKAEIISMQKEIKTLMDNSLIVEKECMNLVSIEKNGIKDELLRFRENRNRTGVYKMRANTPARFVDTMK